MGNEMQASKSRIWRFVTVGVILIGFTAACYFIFKALGLLDRDELGNIIGEGFWSYVVYIGLFVIQAICLSPIPGNTTLFIGVGWILFGQKFWLTFILGVPGVIISSLIMYFLGKTGGQKVMYWLFEKEKLDKWFDKFMKTGSKIIPFLFLFPFMPNDMICLICGMSKMKFGRFAVIIAIFRTFEVFLLLCYALLLSKGLMNIFPWLELASEIRNTF